MFDLLMLITNKQSDVTVMLNKRRYSSELAVFDMSTVILHNTFNLIQNHDVSFTVASTSGVVDHDTAG